MPDDPCDSANDPDQPQADLREYENHIPAAVRRAADKANGLVCAFPRRPAGRRRASWSVDGPPIPQFVDDDPDKLRADAEQYRIKAAKMQGRIDGQQRKADALCRAAVELEDRARLADGAQTAAPFAPNWGGMTIVAAPTEQEIERSADPDAVEREAHAEEQEAVARKYAEQTKAGGQKRREGGARAEVEALYPGVKADLEARPRARSRKITKTRIALEIVKRLNRDIEVETVRGYINDLN